MEKPNQILSVALPPASRPQPPLARTWTRERQPSVFSTPEFLPVEETASHPVISPLLFLWMQWNKASQAVSTYHGLGPSQREQRQAAGRQETGREAGTETRLTLNRSNTIETVLSVLN